MRLHSWGKSCDHASEGPVGKGLAISFRQLTGLKFLLDAVLKVSKALVECVHCNAAVQCKQGAASAVAQTKALSVPAVCPLQPALAAFRFHVQPPSSQDPVPSSGALLIGRQTWFPVQTLPCVT